MGLEVVRKMQGRKSAQTVAQMGNSNDLNWGGSSGEIEIKRLETCFEGRVD